MSLLTCLSRIKTDKALAARLKRTAAEIAARDGIPQIEADRRALALVLAEYRDIAENIRTQLTEQGVDVAVREIAAAPEADISFDQSATEASAAPVFYSAVQRTIENLKMGKASAEQWLKTIRNTPGVKQEELDWMGLPEWLAKQEGSVTKDALLDYVRANQIEVNEVVKGTRFSEPDNASYSVQPIDGGGYEIVDDRGVSIEFHDTLEEADNALSEYETGIRKEDDTRFGAWQLPGGENYRELLMTLPEASFDATQFTARRVRPPDDLGLGEWQVSHNGVPVGENILSYAEENAIKTAINRSRWDNPQSYKSSHFDEKNILAHIRFNERTDADGKRVLFIEEIQSDWHQAGRDKGYKKSTPPTDAELLAQYKADLIANGMKEEMAARLASPENIGSVRGNMALSPRAGAVPDAPFKTTWPELAFKRALRWAVDNGFDRVAWTTGDQQADRYDLSKQVDEVQAFKNDNGTFDIEAWKGGDRIKKQSGLDEKALEAALGKDLAKKIIAEDGDDVPLKDGRSYSGENLKVGGEGMRTFYDKMLPSMANKLTKKWGGKVGETRIGEDNAPLRKPKPLPAKEDLSVKEVINGLGSPTWLVVDKGGNAVIDWNFKPNSLSEDKLVELVYEKISKDYAERSARVEQRLQDLPLTHSLDITPEMREAAKAGLALFQDSRGQITADAQLQRVIITLRSGADATTLAHEMGHYGRLLMEKAATIAQARIDANEPMDANTRATLDLLIKDFDALKKWASEGTGVMDTKAEENIADGFLRYLHTGKSPSRVLGDIFARFRRILTSFFRNGQVPGKDINPEVMEIFGRWMAVDVDIADAATADVLISRIAEFFPDKDIAPKVGQLINRSGNRAAEKLYQEIKAAKLSEMRAEYREQRVLVANRLREEAAQMPVYALQQFIADNGKLDTESVRPSIPADQFAAFPAELLGGTMTMAELDAAPFGYDTGREALRDIVAKPTMDAWVDNEATKVMRREYGNIIDDGRADEMALAYANGSDIGKAIDLLVRAAGEKRVTRRVLKALAAERVADMPLESLRPDRYQAARDKALREAFRKGTIAKGGDAAVLLWKAMVNQEMFYAAQTARLEALKAQALWKHFTLRDASKQARVNKRLAKRYDIAHMTLLQSMLAKHGIGAMPEDGFDAGRLAAELSALHQQTFALGAAIRATELPAQPFKKLTVFGMRQLIVGTENLINAARTSKMVEIEGKKYSVDVDAQELAESFVSVTNRKDRGKAPPVEGITASGFIKSMIATSTKLEHFAHFVDGGNGAMSRMFRLVKDGANNYSDAQELAKQQLNQAIEPLRARMTNEYLDAPELEGGDLTVYGRRAVFAMMLNWGNKGNRERLARGYNLTEEQISAFFRRLEGEGYITAADWKAASDVWATFQFHKPAAWKAHQDAYGYRPDDVTADPFQTSFGPVAGGYYPVAYDPNLGVDAQARELKDLNANTDVSSLFPSARPGSLKERGAGSRDPILLDINYAPRALSQVLKFTHLHAPVAHVSRVFSDPRVIKAARDYSPEFIRNTVSPWLATARAQGGASTTMFGETTAAVINAARNRVAAGAMFANVVNTVQQITDISAALAYTKPSYLRSSVTAALSGNLKNMTDQAMRLSGEMRNRVTIWHEDLPSDFKAIADNFGKIKRGQEWFLEHAYFTQRFVQIRMDVAIWNARFEQGMAEGLTLDDAVQQADSAVRLSQGSSRPEDKAQVSSAMVKELKSMIMFFEWFSNKINQVYYGTRAGTRNKPAVMAAARAATQLTCVLLAPAIMGQAIYDALTGNLPDEREDKDGDGMADEWAVWSLRAVGSVVLPGFGPLGATAQALVGVAADDPVTPRQNPVAGVVINAARSMHSVPGYVAGDTKGSLMTRDVAAILTLSGLPTGQASKAVRFAFDWAEGYTVPDDMWEVTRGLIAGTPRKQ